MSSHDQWVKAAQKAEAQAPQRRLTDAKWYRAHCDHQYECWKADRDLVISHYEPRNDPEPVQRDLFK